MSCSSSGRTSGRQPELMNRRLEAVVRGDVQGVGFRFFVRRQAGRLSVAGWVANEPDGSVRVVAEGSPVALARLLGILRDGPPGAAVSRVDETWLPGDGTFDGFEIRAGGHSGD
jgi:acylphosphatase